MLNYSKLMTLAEASTGFVGGSIVDEFPGMSLSECAGRLPVVCLESQIELTRAVAEQNEAIVEATINAIQCGNSSEADALVEGALSTVWNHIKTFFEKLKKFIKSIIDKLTLQINKMRMTGKQLLARYEHSDMIKHEFTDLVVNGYKFKDAGEVFVGLDSVDPSKLVKAIAKDMDDPATFQANAAANADAAADSPEVTKLSDSLQNLKDISAEDRKLACAEQLVKNVSLTANDWIAEIKNELYGEKVDMTYGTDFTLDEIKSILRCEDYDKVKNAYTNLGRAVEANQKTIESSCKKAREAFEKTKSEGNSGSKALSIVADYFSTYMSFYQDCSAVVTEIQNIRMKYEDAKVVQAKNIFAKMLTYKPKKDNADASDMEGLDELDVIL